jgi:hypothetical protein
MGMIWIWDDVGGVLPTRVPARFPEKLANQAIPRWSALRPVVHSKAAPIWEEWSPATADIFVGLRPPVRPHH